MLVVDEDACNRFTHDTLVATAKEMGEKYEDASDDTLQFGDKQVKVNTAIRNRKRKRSRIGGKTISVTNTQRCVFQHPLGKWFESIHSTARKENRTSLLVISPNTTNVYKIHLERWNVEEFLNAISDGDRIWAQKIIIPTRQRFIYDRTEEDYINYLRQRPDRTIHKDGSPTFRIDDPEKKITHSGEV